MAVSFGFLPVSENIQLVRKKWALDEYGDEKLGEKKIGTPQKYQCSFINSI